MRHDTATDAQSQQQQQQQQQAACPEPLALRSSCVPVQSGSALPKLRRRTASGSSADSEVRQSLELDAAAANPAPRAASRIPIFLSPAEADADAGEAADADGRSSSGPINGSGAGSPVKRTRSLKEQLINKFSSSLRRGLANPPAPEAQAPAMKPTLLKDVDVAVGSPSDSPKATTDSEEFSFDSRPAAQRQQRSASPKKGHHLHHHHHHDSSLEDIAQSRHSGASTPTKQLPAARPLPAPKQQHQQQQQHQLNRNRAGSLRGNPVVKVLPDRPGQQAISKASSSENISQQADLNTLTSLVQKKRDRSQESLEHSAKAVAAAAAAAAAASASAASSSVVHRKPPTPTSLDSDDGSDTTAKSGKPPTGKREAGGRRMDSPTAGDCPQPEAAVEANCDTDRESPCDEQQSDGEVPAAGHKRSSSFEMLIQDAQSRTAPQIRQPSARPVRIESARRDNSPCKAPGASPPKAVSFNLNHEVNMFEEESRDHRRRRHHHHSHRSRKDPADRNGDASAKAEGSSKIGDNALIEVHGTLVETMENTISKQRVFLTQAKEGKITISDYRDIMKTLLQMQTKTIHQIVDTIQSNEKSS